MFRFIFVLALIMAGSQSVYAYRTSAGPIFLSFSNCNRMFQTKEGLKVLSSSAPTIILDASEYVKTEDSPDNFEVSVALDGLEFVAYNNKLSRLGNIKGKRAFGGQVKFTGIVGEKLRRPGKIYFEVKNDDSAFAKVEYEGFDGVTLVREFSTNGEYLESISRKYQGRQQYQITYTCGHGFGHIPDLAWHDGNTP